MQTAAGSGTITPIPARKNDGSTEADLVLHNGSQFSLKAGETIRIKYLPIGLRYEITELDPDGYTVTNTVDGVLSGGGSAQGTIIKDIPGTVVFTNTMKKGRSDAAEARSGRETAQGRCLRAEKRRR